MSLVSLLDKNPSVLYAYKTKVDYLQVAHIVEITIGIDRHAII